MGSITAAEFTQSVADQEILGQGRQEGRQEGRRADALLDFSGPADLAAWLQAT